MNQAASMEEGLSKRLKAATNSTHQRLDDAIMAAKPFDSLDNYREFLKVQYFLHRDVAPLYVREDLEPVLPGLAALSRFDAVAKDVQALDVQLPEGVEEPGCAGLSFHEALGWLYVVEGSNLGAAFLLKASRQIGLSEVHGAMHLAAAPEGRGAHWRKFTTDLNAIPLSQSEEAAAMEGAKAAFAHVSALARRFLQG